MTHGSLFSGIGGFDLAARWMGWENAFHCEINEFCTRILKTHFPDAEHYNDITKTDFTKWRGKIDVLSGGFPCQPFSLAGRRKGAEDDRYLWPQMLRAVCEIRPTWIVGENVAGILTMVQPGEEVEMGSEASLFGEADRKRVLLRQQYVTETVCRDLEGEGYSVQPFVIPACAVGAPHRRDRIWFVAHRADAGAEILQYGRQDGVCAVGSVTHADIDRCREREDKQVTVPQCQRASYDCTGCEDGAASIPSSQRCDNRSDNREERQIHVHGKRDAEGSQRSGDKREHRSGENGKITSDTTGQQSEWSEFGEREPCRKWEGKFGGSRCGNGYSLPQSQWADFPTQPPVRSGDDGLSSRLDGITFPKWRSESVKAYGNAVVPQVVYEIFKAIEETYKDIQP